jgi:UDP-2,3-diacylglucosamine pyrophosphatase LpxH
MNAPIFVISDLHIGSGGVRDSFSQNNRHLCFNKFLDYVEKEDGELVILGDIYTNTVILKLKAILSGICYKIVRL